MEGRREAGKKTRTVVLNAALNLGSFENHEGHGPTFQKNTPMQNTAFGF